MPSKPEPMSKPFDAGKLSIALARSASSRSRRGRTSWWLLAAPLVAFGLFTASRVLFRRPAVFEALVEKGHLSFDPRTVVAGVYAPAMWILNGGWVLPLTGRPETPWWTSSPAHFAPTIAHCRHPTTRRWPRRGE